MLLFRDEITHLRNTNRLYKPQSGQHPWSQYRALPDPAARLTAKLPSDWLVLRLVAGSTNRLPDAACEMRCLSAIAILGLLESRCETAEAIGRVWTSPSPSPSAFCILHCICARLTFRLFLFFCPRRGGTEPRILWHGIYFLWMPVAGLPQPVLAAITEGEPHLCPLITTIARLGGVLKW